MIATRDGYFEASPGAARFARWSVGEELCPFARFAARFHHPEKVREVVVPELLPKNRVTAVPASGSPGRR